MQPSFMSSPIFTAAGEDFPSFAARDGSLNWISATEDWLPPATNLEKQESSDAFEFSRNADNIFSAYPLFGCDLLDSGSPLGTTEAVELSLQQLFMEERNTSNRSSTSSSSDMDGTPDTFCLWIPRSLPQSPNRWKKSRSTGSMSRRWRLRDLVFGRSHSDGKEKLGFLAAGERKGAISSPGREDTKSKKKESKPTEMDIVTAHRLYYAKSGSSGKRSFLPYKQNITGFFGQAHHPF